MQLADLAKNPSILAKGHRTCRGCGIPLVVRQILRVFDRPVIIVNATGCLEVTTCFGGDTSWKTPYLHTAFGCAPAAATGVAAVLKHRARNAKVVVFAGDGATFDIGLAALSGMMSRGDDVLYVCYNNEAYMNTGVQCSGATPPGALTQTTPAGNQWPAKDIMQIVAAHSPQYAAQASISHWMDLSKKAQKAFSIKGPAFLHVLSPCPLGWRSESSLTVRLAQLAVETGYWPLLSYERGKWSHDLPIANRAPVKEFLKIQGRFSERDYATIQGRVDEKWNQLGKLCEN